MKLSVRLLLLASLALLSPGAGAAERTIYFVPDAQGSPVAAMDEQGNVLWRETYAPYGERKTKSPDNSAKVAYTGKPEDPDTGLVYMGARMYDPETGRFTGVDPQGFKEGNPQSFGRYLYANNSPYRYVDPNGEAIKEVITDLMPQAGKSFAALFAYATGLVQGDPFLEQGAVDGMRDMRVDSIMAIGSAFSPPGMKEAVRLKKIGATAEKEKKVYRVFGGDAKADGASWTDVDPSTVKDYRNAAGLPSGGASGATNSGRFVIEGTLVNPSAVVKTREAHPLDGKTGGITELVIPNGISSGAIRIDRVSGVNPEF